MREKTDSHSLLIDCNAAPFILKGLRSVSIKEHPVPVKINDKAVGSFHGLEVFEKVQEIVAYPQTIADLVSNMYFRLTYQTSDGRSATFGTSIIGTPSLGAASGFQFIPTVSEARVQFGDPTRLSINVAGNFGDFARVSSARTYSTEASIYKTKMTAEIAISFSKDIRIEPSRLGNDAFRLFTISSMFSSHLYYDGSLIKYKTREDINAFDLRSIKSRKRYIFNKPQMTTEFELVKEIGSTGKRNTPGSHDSPSVSAKILETNIPTEELGVQAYLDNSTNVNNDSLSVWLEWMGCPAIIPKGQEISAVIEFSAFPPGK